MSQVGSVDIEFSNLLKVIKLYGVDNKDVKYCFEMVHAVYREVQKHFMDKEKVKSWR